MVLGILGVLREKGVRAFGDFREFDRAPFRLKEGDEISDYLRQHGKTMSFY